MKIDLQLSNEELKEIALKQNKTVDEVVGDYKHMLKELEYSNKKLNEIIEKNSYIRFPNNFSLHKYGENDELNSKYSCYDNLNIFNKFKKSELAIVTGFGPTNSPTAGTLCSIFRVLELQKLTSIYTHIIISELSALNSRQKPLNELIINSHQFISFIKKLGFDEANGEIRTHNDHDHARVFSLVSADAEIGALHGKLISGFFPYVKMSKSIPDSSINLGDSEERLYKKIIKCGQKNEEIILQMIILASNWNHERINRAKNAFKNISGNYEEWEIIKYEYLDFFIKIKKLWDDSRYYKTINTHAELFLDK